MLRLRFRPHVTLLIALLALIAPAGCSLPFNAQPTPAPIIIIATPTPQPGAAAQATALPAPTQPPAATVAPADTAAPAATEAPAATAVPAAGSVLQRVKDRGRLICGVNADLPGFGFYDNVRQRWSGFDIDFCRAIAAAIFADAEAVEYVALTTSGANERFAAVREGRVDVLIRNTTWTLGRDISGLAFGPTTFHDGQTFMVRRADNIATIDQLADKRICVAEGTTSALNLRDVFAARGLTYEEAVYPDEGALYPAYDEGECDAITSDSSQLASEREALTNPDDHVILGDRISREPLGPVFIENDDQWRDVVSWVVFATMYAEELGVNQSNIERQASQTQDPRIRRLVGAEGELGTGLGLLADFGYQIIFQVGSYADIYERNLGPDTPFNLERGPNKAWNLGAGGVLASPPFR